MFFGERNFHRVSALFVNKGVDLVGLTSPKLLFDEVKVKSSKLNLLLLYQEFVAFA